MYPYRQDEESPAIISYQDSSNQQSSSSSVTEDYYYDDQEEDSCEYCKLKSQKLTFKDFCKNDLVMVVQINNEQPKHIDQNELDNLENRNQFSNSNYVKYSTIVDSIYKNQKENNNKKSNNNKFYQIVNSIGSMSSSYEENANNVGSDRLQEDEKLSIWLDNKDLLCSCPKIKMRRKYLIMNKNSNLLKYINDDYNTDRDINNSNINNNSTSTSTSITKTSQSKSAGFLIERDTFIIEWKNEYAKRLRRFVKHYNNGKCS